MKTWVTRILVRQAARHFRSGRRYRAGGDEPGARPAAEASFSSAERETDARMDLQKAMLALSPDHREVIVFREFQGLSYDEIAEVLAIPRGTVESRLFRARRELQALLRDYLP